VCSVGGWCVFISVEIKNLNIRFYYKMPHTCEYCNKNFTQKASMFRHQKNTKFCLSIQENIKSRDKMNTKKEYVIECHQCFKKFSCKSNKTRHKCKIKIIIDESNKNREQLKLLKIEMKNIKMVSRRKG
jgi:hypothetical protein